MKFLVTLFFLSSLFHVSAQVPTIDSMSVYVGIPGDLVTIYGTNFHPTLDSNIVRFGPVKSIIVSASPTQLVVEFPAGSRFGKTTVVCNGRTAWSSKNFLPTFAGNGIMDLPTFGGNIVLDAGGNGVRDVRAVDIDGDGKQEMLACGSTTFGEAIRVWQNVGNASEINLNSWPSSIDFPLVAIPRSMGVDDIDGDGKPDVVVVLNNGTSLAIFKNTSTVGVIDGLSFAAPVYYPCSGSPQDLELADIDGDGKLDVVLGNHYFDGVITVFRNSSIPGVINGSSLEPQIHFYGGQYIYNITVNDFNGDGKIDVAAAAWGSDSMFVFVNNAAPGTINASSFLPSVGFQTPSAPRSIYSGDFNGDGKIDLVTSHLGLNQLKVYENTSITSLIDASSFNNSIILTPGAPPVELMVIDLTNDGKPEIITANISNPASVSIFQNIHGTGALTASTFASDIKFGIGPNCQGLFASDINGDSKPEIMMSSASGGSVEILPNNISGNFISSGMFGSKLTWYNGGNLPRGIGLGDFDDDGKPDVLTSSNTGSNSAVWPNNSTPGSITYAAQLAGQFSINFNGTLTGNQVIDLDSDGKLDIIYNDYLVGHWAVSRNIHINGNPLNATSFDSSPWFWSLGGLTGPEHADLNKDGRADFVNGNYPYNYFRMSENLSTPGNLNFGPFFSHTAVPGNAGKDITPEDLDNDGDMDLVIGGANQNRIYFMENKGNLTLNSSSFFSTKIMYMPSRADKVFPIDINEDGWKDLVVFCGLEGLYIYLHDGVGGTLDSTMFNPNAIHLPYLDGDASYRSFDIADFNSDGKPDFCYSSESTNELVIWLNNTSGGTVAASDFTELRFGVGSIYKHLRVSDFDLDGKPDVYFTDVNNTFSMLRNESGEGVLPIITTYQSASLCPGDSIELFAPQADSYLWSSGDTTSSITVGIANNYSVITTTGGINDTLDAITVTMSPLIDVSIVDPLSQEICFGDSLNTTSMGAVASYSWNVGDSNDYIIPTQSGFYSVTVVNSQGCSKTDTITIQVGIESVVDLWADSLACDQQCIVLSASLNTTVQSVLWSPGTGLSDATIEAPTVCMDSAITYHVEYIDVNGCVARDSVVLTVEQLPVLISNDTTICATNSVGLQVNNGETFVWTPSMGLSATNIANPIANPVITTQYFVQALSIGGCMIQDSILITVNQLPELLTNDTTVCIGDSVLLQATAGGSYTWGPSTGLSSTSIATSTATVLSDITYTLNVIDGNGCSITDSVLIETFPEPIITLWSDSTVCEGECFDYTPSVSTGIGSASWSPGINLSDSTIANPTVCVLNDQEYVIRITDLNGCVVTDTTSAWAVAVPSVPSISLNGTTLTSTISTTYQWFIDGQLIAGATNQTYDITQNGVYYVEVTVGTECTEVSDTLNVADLGIEVSSYNPWSISPNPTTGYITIQGDIDQIDRIEIMDNQGKVVYSQVHPEESIDLRLIASGTYYIRVLSSSEAIVQKIIIQH